MKYVALGDYCTITSSKRIFADQYVESGIPFYRSKEIIEKNNNITISEPLYISYEVYNEIKEKFGVPQKDDLLLTSVGTIGIPYVVKDEVFYFKDGNLTWMKDFSPELSSKYLYYWLSSKFGKTSLTNRCIGSSQSALTIDILTKYKFMIPERRIQDKIVEILSAYDELISKNIRRIRILEKMAEELYKEWFVRFRFPGHENSSAAKSKLGAIPSSFSIIQMKDAISYYIGGGWGNDEKDKNFQIPAYVIRGTDFPHVAQGDLSTCPYRYHKQSNYSARRLQPDDIVLEVSGGTAEQPVGRTLLVTSNVIERLRGSVICASFCKQLRVNTNVISPYYFYYWMRFLYDTRMIEKFQLQSTGIINFKFEYFLRKGDVLLPSRKLMLQFEKFIVPIHDEIDVLSRKNENLIRQRNILISRLMSGILAIK